MAYLATMVDERGVEVAEVVFRRFCGVEGTDSVGSDLGWKSMSVDSALVLRRVFV